MPISQDRLGILIYFYLINLLFKIFVCLSIYEYGAENTIKSLEAGVIQASTTSM